MTVTLSQTEAEDRLRFWQGVLNLEEWDISIRIARHFDMLPNTQGSIWRHDNQKMADVALLHPDDRDPLSRRSYDMEITLVHELLHIHFWESRPLKGDEDERGEERAIDAIAKALTALHRKAFRSLMDLKVGGTD